MVLAATAELDADRATVLMREHLGGACAALAKLLKGPPL